MSEPAVFALVRNGEVRYFADRWANASLRREVMWGPADFEAWVLQFEPLETWEDECDGGVVVDFDRRILAWNNDPAHYRVPRVSFVYRKLLEAAWPDFEIKHVAGGTDELVRYLNLDGDANPTALAVRYTSTEESNGRPETVEEAQCESADADATDVDSARAWITIVEADGQTRQRQLAQLPVDLLQAKPAAIAALAELKPAPIPRESTVAEGLCINPSQRAVSLWGSSDLLDQVKKNKTHWQGWNLTWMKRGYADQCAAAATPGLPMSSAEAVAKIVPLVLSTQQFNTEVMLGAIGGGLKRFANKAVGCLLFVLCLPLVVFGLVSGNWTSVLVSIAVTATIVLGGYALIVSRFKRMVRRQLDNAHQGRANPGIAGPQDDATRRQRIDALLRKAGLPRLAQVEPLFSSKSGLELLAQS